MSDRLRMRPGDRLMFEAVFWYFDFSRIHNKTAVAVLLCKWFLGQQTSHGLFEGFPPAAEYFHECMLAP